MITVFKVDLQWTGPRPLTVRGGPLAGAQKNLEEISQVTDPEVAIFAYRALLRRDDLVGLPVSARLVTTAQTRALYYSHFTLPLGNGRIHPAAPLLLPVERDVADQIAAWTPPFD